MVDLRQIEEYYEGLFTEYKNTIARLEGELRKSKNNQELIDKIKYLES